MGLERITSILQGVNDNYKTDLFAPIIERERSLVGRVVDDHPVVSRVLADHSRAMTFLMADGVTPGNEGRGYVLRMIMRRAMRFARSVGLTQPFLGELASVVVDQMGATYSELNRQRRFIDRICRAEEERFAQTLSNGLQRLEEIIDAVRARGQTTIPGSDVFRLYDTFGFPVEMTRDVAREHGLAIDDAGFAVEMESQRERARAAQVFASTGASDQRFAELADEGIVTEFVGYKKSRARAKVVALFTEGKRADEAPMGREVEIVLDRTPFYAEAGGQVGDTGRLRASRLDVEISDTVRPTGAVVVHRGRVKKGRLRVGVPVTAEIDVVRRADIMRNHTATHLLHKALQDVLGEHARQAGSLVAPDRLRFDFVHTSALSEEQREAVERAVNEKVLEDVPVRARWMSYDEATKLGAMALFGEKYGDRVRVISIDGYSRELCGGTHLSRTGQVGMFKITAEGGIAAGVRRIEAVTGRGAYELLRKHESTLRTIADQLRAVPEEVPERVRRLSERVKELDRQLKVGGEHTEARETFVQRAIDRSVELAGVRFVIERTDAANTDVLRGLADRIRQALDARGQPGVIVLASDATGQVVATKTRRVNVAPTHVGEFVKSLTSEFGGNGGGRADFAQGGLKDPARIADLVDKGRDPRFLQTFVGRPS